MSEEDTQLQQFFNDAEQLREEIILNEPFPVLDATAAMFLVYGEYGKTLQEGGLLVRRMPAAEGLVFWQLLDRGGTGYGAIMLRMLGDRQTYVGISPGPRMLSDNPEQARFARYFLRVTLDTFLFFLGKDRKEMQRLGAVPTGEHIGAIGLQTALQYIATPRPRGAKPDPDNEWARKEIALGRDRQEVFQGYLQRQGIDPDNRKEVLQARERFKKALSGPRGRKVK
jgi:hypothetical protein